MSKMTDPNGKITTPSYPYNDPSNRGHFKHGNPGRPVGAKGKPTAKAITEALETRRDSALIALDRLLALGDPRAVLFVVDRLLPKGRSTPMHGLAAEDIEAAIMDGSISAAEARELAQALVAVRSLRDLDEMAETLRKLEALFERGGEE